MATVNEQLISKIEAQLLALKNLVNCEILIIDKRLNTFSDTLNHVFKDLEVSQNSNTDLLKENVEYLKKELNSKDQLLKSLIDTQTAILDTIGKSKRDKGKGYLQVEPSLILTPEQQENQSYHKNTIYVANLDSNVSIEDIYKTNCISSHILRCRFSIKSANPKNQRSCLYNSTKTRF